MFRVKVGLAALLLIFKASALLAGDAPEFERSAVVLRYFGDDAGRGACGGCDNCLGLHAGKERHQPGPARTRREKAAPAAKTRQPATSRVEPDPANDVLLDGDAARLFASLKTLRSSIAREQQVPAYVVFTDRTLAEFAARKPRTKTALLEVRGVGQAKVDKYGDRFLAAIQDADETEAA